MPKAFLIKSVIDITIVRFIQQPKKFLISEVIFWCNNKLIDVQKVKNSDLQIGNF